VASENSPFPRRRTMCHTARVLVSVLVATALLTGCPADNSSSSSATEPQILLAPAPPSFPGANAFVAEIDNPYLGYARGRVFTYEALTDEGVETIVITVTNESKDIMGVSTTVVHDQAFLNGELVEDTFDWFAQDQDGNVWYFGEDTVEFENGEPVSTEGSWEAGVDGALPGIIMLANPIAGMKYRQEFAVGVAEDMAQVKSLKVEVELLLGEFENCLETKEWTLLSPGGSERKVYAAGTGLVLELSTNGNGNQKRTELISIED
ncbi:MAG TPA: hypothetical protein VJU16_09140, partial [Planctomycetota bacterium]|nr:hypothetical protein [Planctomycetota bacterium]